MPTTQTPSHFIWGFRIRTALAIRLGFLVLALFNAGCVALVASAAIGGVAAAGYVYMNGTLSHTWNVNLDTTLAAVRASLSDLQLPLLSEVPAAGEFLVASRTADDSPIRIKLTVVPGAIPADGVHTRVTVRVGFGGNDILSARILDQINLRLKGPPVAQTNLAPTQTMPQQKGSKGIINGKGPQETAPPPLAKE